MKQLSTKLVNFEEMKGEYPETLYKYRSWIDKFHKTVLTEKQLYYSSPNQFEDPKDCKLTVRFDLLSAQEKLSWIEHKLKQQNPEKNRNFYRSEARRLFKSSPISDNKKIKELQKNALEEYNLRTGVLSLTGNPNNNGMWDKYGDKHKGYCVGFDPLILFEQLGGGGMVQYVKELPIVYPEPKHNHQEQMVYQVFYKEDKWSFEEEYRTHTFHHQPMSNKDRIINVPKEAFKTLIFGKNMSNEDKENIIKTIHPDLNKIEIIEK